MGWLIQAREDARAAQAFVFIRVHSWLICMLGGLDLEGFPQNAQALGYAGFRIFFALEFQGDVAVVIRLAERASDAVVIEIERVPFAASVVRLGLDEHGFGRD